MLEAMRFVLLCMLEVPDVMLCVQLFAGGVGVLEMLEAMHCELRCMPEASEVMRCVLFVCWRSWRVGSVCWRC